MPIHGLQSLPKTAFGVIWLVDVTQCSVAQTYIHKRSFTDVLNIHYNLKDV
jgi:hypothetical protein